MINSVFGETKNGGWGGGGVCIGISHKDSFILCLPSKPNYLHFSHNLIGIFNVQVIALIIIFLYYLTSHPFLLIFQIQFSYFWWDGGQYQIYIISFGFESLQHGTEVHLTQKIYNVNRIPRHTIILIYFHLNGDLLIYLLRIIRPCLLLIFFLYSINNIPLLILFLPLSMKKYWKPMKLFTSPWPQLLQVLESFLLEFESWLINQKHMKG